MTEHTLEIDWTRCDGHGLCMDLLPDRIVEDDWGFPLLRRTDVTTAELADTRRAAAMCPALALRVTGR
ncbi:MAG TPA: ferredoxin [Jatrophihabitans sp.]|jgi:ferredoxin